jgi:hypothetical protein
MLVHVGHHRAGSTWFQNIMRAVTARFGMRFQAHESGEQDPRAEMIVMGHPQPEMTLEEGVFRGSHMIRDPRDVIVSAYHYHLWSDEPWLHEARPDLGGMTYQEYWRSLDRDAAITEYIRAAPWATTGEMVKWNYDRSEFLELRYEDVIGDEAAAFTRLFTHYGFSERAVEVAVATARRFTFERVGGRKLGETREGQHLRSGRPGAWRDVLTPHHKELFKEVAGDILIKLGYETNVTW